MNKTYVTGRLYRVKKEEVIEKGSGIPFWVIGGTVTAYGSSRFPSSIANMADIFPDDSPLAVGVYEAGSLFTYISFTGSATSIQLDNVNLEDLGAIS